MVSARAEILIQRPPERVYGFVARDLFANYPRWSPEVRRLDVLTPGPVRVGSRARQVRVDQGRQSESSFRVTALEEPLRLDFAEGSDLFRISYRLAPMGADTRFTFAFELTRLEFYMRPFEKLIRVTVQEGAERVVRNIKGLVERESESPGNAVEEP
ncbi:MAG TPA: SRPBCC family protein [Lamprocystis sp. (in: g-proteobacteria)]|nr:SRPBCC family protein [Lamprocystis sp. (in: g-proteobacteria)]